MVAAMRATPFVLLALLAACTPPPVGTETTPRAGGRVFSFDAGFTELGYGYYLIDTLAGVCWFGTVWGSGGSSLAPLDCCKLLRIKETRAHLGFIAPNQCPGPLPVAAPATRAPQPGPPAPPATNP